MGYQMIYQTDQKNTLRRNPLRRQTMVAICFLVFSLTVRLFWEPGTQMLRELLLPGELSLTEAAIAQLVDDLKQGSGFGTAAEVFCHRVINGGA